MIALITPTGCRPKQLALCSKWMQHQTYKGEVLWVIVDDGKEDTSSEIHRTFIKDNWYVVTLRPTPFWEEGQNTQCRNLLTASDYLKDIIENHIDNIFIIEDDDYYSPSYLSTMMTFLQTYDLVAEANTIYYHIKEKAFKIMNNETYGSLFETAFNSSYLSFFTEVVLTNAKFIDNIFWKTFPSDNKKMLLFPKQERLAIGIKGIEGRAGIGIGHKDSFAKKRMQKKPLNTFLGVNAQYYNDL